MAVLAVHDLLLGPDLWQVIIQGCLVIGVLLVLARLVALLVRPDMEWPLSEGKWRAFAWAGMVTLLLVTPVWTIFALTELNSQADRVATWIVLIASIMLSAAAYALIGVSLARGQRIVVPKGESAGRGWAFSGWSFLVLASLLLLLTAGWISALAVGAPARGYLATSALSACGVVVFGLGLGTRLRLRVSVRKSDGTEDPAGAAYVVSRISTMGHKPRGLMTPEGSDALELPQDAVAALPAKGQVAASIVRFVLLLFAVAPWRADIVLVDGETATVDLRRNGGPAASTLVFRSELGLPDLDTAAADGSEHPISHDLLTASSAFLLIRLSERHTILKTGLCGATRWRGLACQVLAGTPPWQSRPEVAQELYARALDKDPENDAAWLGYLGFRAGNVVGSREEQNRYILRLRALLDRLCDKADRDEGYVALGMRAARNLIYARLNYLLLPQTGPRTPEDEKRERNQQIAVARDDLDQLWKLVRKAAGSRNTGLKTFAGEMEPIARILDSALSGSLVALPADDLRLSRRPDCNYVAACVNIDAGDFQAAIERLDLALGLKAWRAEARTDPSMARLREKGDEDSRAELAALVDRPKLTDMESLRPFARKLENSEIHFAEGVLTHPTPELAKILEVPEATAEWLRQVCTLVKRCHRPELAMPWTDLLIREGIDTVGALRSALSDAAEIRRLKRLAAVVSAPPLTEDEIKEWLRQLTIQSAPPPAGTRHGRGRGHRRTNGTA